MAFQNYKPWLGITGSEFVGLDNFRQMKYARMLLEQKAKEIEIEADGILSSESLRRLQNTIKGDYDVWQYVTDATDVKDYLKQKQNGNVGMSCQRQTKQTVPSHICLSKWSGIIFIR